MLEHSFRKSLPFTFAGVIALLSLAFWVGCGDGGSQRVAVWGDVTWNGQPVPAGIIYFSPDAKKGNRGPQGFALIKEGHFDSRDEFSKGCVTGPLVAVVQGCSGQGKSSDFPYGRLLFEPVELPLEVPAEGGQMDLVIPDTAVAPPVAAEADAE